MTRQHPVGKPAVHFVHGAVQSEATCTSENNCKTSVAYVSGKTLYIACIFHKNVVKLYFKFTVGGFCLVFAQLLPAQYSQYLFILLAEK